MWYFRVDRVAHGREQAMQYLDASERERYERYFDPAKRDQFSIGRMLLKQTLARYRGEAPERLRLLYTQQRKPFLAGDLAFNLSHSGPYLGVAVARRSVGVDIQEERDVSPQDVLRGLSAEECRRVRPEVLFIYWVLKEAWWKADCRAVCTRWLLDRIASEALSEQTSFSVRLGSWCLSYLRPRPGLHVGLAIEHPRPIWTVPRV